MHGLDWYDYGARNYESVLSRFTTMDPLAEKYYSISPYAYCAGNPVMFVDPDGRRSVPLNDSYNGWYIKVDSWFGPRNTGLPGASTYHRGLDFNYSGGGNTDYGTPILATHDGYATVDNNSSGAEGRSVTITAPDGSFRTRYFHLSEINIINNQSISEADNIAKMGGSANGKDLGRTSHLHYDIQEMRNGKWISIDPTNGNNNISNIIDPQKRINPIDITYDGGTLPEIIIIGTKIK